MNSEQRFAPRHRVIPWTRAVLAAVAVVLSLTAARADADDVNIVPSLGLSTEYNDNIYYASSKTRDLRVSVIPGLEFTDRTELLDAGLVSTLKGFKSLKDSRFDAIDFRFDGRMAYQLTPRLKVSATAEYDRDSNPGQEANRIAVTTNLVRRYQQQYTLQNEFEITPATSIIAGYSYIQQYYVTLPLPSAIQAGGGGSGGGTGGGGTGGGGGGGGGGGPLTVEQILSSADVKIHNPTLSLKHNFNERTKGSLDAGYSGFRYQFSTVDNYTVSLGLNRMLNEVWTVSASAGGRYTRSVFSPVKQTITLFPFQIKEENQPQEINSGFGWIGQLALAYNGEYASGTLSLHRDVSPGRLSADERTGITLDTSYRFTEDLSASFNAGYQLSQANRGQFASEAVDDRTLQIRVGVHYNFTRDISLDGGYSKVIADYTSLHVDQNYVYLNLLFKYPLYR